MRRAGASTEARLGREETARLLSLWRLAAGAAHTTNNALTAILGEASYLRDEYKADPQVVACCDAITAEVDRCARLMRALLVRRQPARCADETDLGRLLGELRELLPETLGRRYEVSVEPLGELAVVAGGPTRIELLVLCLLQVACARAGQQGRIELSARAGPRSARIALAVHAPGLAAEDARAFDADGAADPAQHTLVVAANELLEELEATLDVRAAPGRLETHVELALAPD